MWMQVILPDERAEERIATHLGGDVSRLIDLTRAAVVMLDIESIRDAERTLGKQDDSSIVYRRDRIATPSRLGFADLKVYLRDARGYISAVRLVPKAMLQAQGVALSLLLRRAALLSVTVARSRFLVIVADLFNFEEPDGVTCIDGFASLDDARRYARARQRHGIDVLREDAAGDGAPDGAGILYTRWLCLGEALAVVDGDAPTEPELVADEIDDMIEQPADAEAAAWPVLGQAANARAIRLRELVMGKELEAIVERHASWCRARREPMSQQMIDEFLQRQPEESVASDDGPIRAWLAKSPTWKTRLVKASILTFTRPPPDPGDGPAIPEAADQDDPDRADLSGTSFFNVWDTTVGPVIDGLNLEAARLDEVVLDGYTLSDASFQHASLVRAQLSSVLARRCSFRFADMREARVVGAQFRGGDLQHAILDNADLRNGEFFHSYFTNARLPGANLSGAMLVDADFTDADLSGADLRGADLRWCRMVRTVLNGAKLDGARVFGLSAWSIKTDKATSQRGLIITEKGAGATVDRLDIAQLLHLVTDNRNLTHLVDTLASRLVLILGRFVAPRMEVLRFVAGIVERHGLIPVIFDFDPPERRDITETIGALAHLSALVIADLTDPRSVPQELTTIVRSLPSLQVIPIIDATQEPYSMFPHFRSYPWVQEPLSFVDLAALDRGLDERLAATRST